MVHTIEELFRRLLDLMKQQDELMERLLQAGGRQQDALRANNIMELNSAVTAISELARQLTGIEKDRLAVQREAEANLGLPKDSTLQALLTVAPEYLRDELKDRRRLLRCKTDLFKDLNSVNQLMVKNALRLNHYMIKTLLPPEETYGGNGTLTGARANTLVNKTI
ncbi:MAG: flagellar protein FlgN [Bacillota bacterium]|jgi:flagellar biosynthesis/type III secretory pathway chaperone